MREVKVPVSLLLAVIGGSESNIEALIADRIGYVSDDEIEEYKSDHCSEARRALSGAMVNGWRRVHHVKEAA